MCSSTSSLIPGPQRKPSSLFKGHTVWDSCWLHYNPGPPDDQITAAIDFCLSEEMPPSLVYQAALCSEFVDTIIFSWFVDGEASQHLARILLC